jgi:4-amino-4-deoxy-L-arabinose transferase-like glycosyltransferase
VKLFGFTGFSIFLPQALCGLGAVLLLYYLVRRHFGTIAGLVAALALAVSPISVVTNRNNTIDGTLALILLLAAWAVFRACETGKLRWLLLGGVFVGLGFNTKMSEAYLIIPALGAAYFLCGPRKIWTCIWHLLVVLVVMLVISLSWAAAVDLTPAAQRPYVDSTKDNSEISLAVGYNGLNRLHINLGGAATTRTTTHTATHATIYTLQSMAALIAAPDPTPTDPSKSDAAPSNPSGPFRLFNSLYGSQIGWLLSFALLAILALAWRRRSTIGRAQQSLSLVLWGFWLLTTTVFFTLDSSFHQYYLTVMAPPLCALVGIGLFVMWDQYRAPGWRGWFLPIALAITAVAQLSILTYYPDWSQHLRLFIIIPIILVVLVLVILRLTRRQATNANSLRLASISAGVGLFALLLAPLVWSCYTVAHNPESSAPVAGPSAQSSFSNFLFTHGDQAPKAISNQTPQMLSKINSKLISYLEAQQGHTKFLIATTSPGTAETLVLATNKPVIAMGGFSGNDPILTISSLQALIKNGTIRFFLLDAPKTVTGQGSLTKWISSHCKNVPKKDWQQGKTAIGGNGLYDCASL